MDDESVKAHYGAMLFDNYMKLLTGPGSEDLWRSTVVCKGPHGTHKDHKDCACAVGSR